ncbi:mannan endo-1,6-alpha-mannosidase [Aureobasidium sp. EXF-8845]|nr:mannan endo-1,6-alpha-mannosidase [Aureobasidium sp. EXF-8845]KAI4857037.1 mannan endo-1,6-alpha-mannosidase [Aureobasidium sp. EXF-8846]
MMKHYKGNETGGVPGLLPEPYFWWEAGAMFGAMIDYWHYTGDGTYNDLVTDAMLFQAGENADYMPVNQSRSLGNDDQGFWGLAAMSAAEVHYPNPPDAEPQWLALAQAVFNTQAAVWDKATCGGGLKWQKFTFNNGYNYKNTISNGLFFNLAARLAAYTQNETYLHWANTAWDWTATVGLMTKDYMFFDGTDDRMNCSDLNHIQWSYNAGVYLLRAATMWNITGTHDWHERAQGIFDSMSVFFTDDPPSVMYEVAYSPYTIF